MQQAIIEGFRLSPQQKRIWSLQQAEPTASYMAHCAVSIEGTASDQLLRAAIADVVARHEILRTSFRYLDGMDVPLQVIGEQPLLREEGEDLRTLYGPEEREALIERLFNEALNRPVELESESPLRTSIYVLADDLRLLFLTLPALCADTASLKKLVEEIGNSYAALANGGCERAEVSMNYADFSEWQNELLEAEETEAGREYWTGKIVADHLDAQLPFEARPVESAPFAARSLRLKVDARTREGLEGLAVASGVSFSTLLFACWQVLLWRLVERSELVTGLAYDGRKFEELSDVIGPLTRFLPVSCSVDPGAPFNAFLAQVQQATEENNKWQDYFDWSLLAGAQSEGRLYAPFNFDFEDLGEPLATAGLRFSLEQRAAHADRFKVKLSCTLQERALITEFHYDSSRLSVEGVSRLAGQFQQLLKSVIENPLASVRQLDILNAAERRQLLLDFNETEADYSPEHGLHGLFEAQAKRTPERLALSFENQNFTYGELDRRANLLARYLRRRGVGREVVVGLLIDRSPAMVISLLAILKAGGAYLPLDPEYPQQRLSYMMRDAGVKLVVSQRGLASKVAEPGIDVLCVDEEQEQIALENAGELEVEVGGEELAYIIYTSGSTGQPKGVMLAHRSVCNFMHTMRRRPGLVEDDVLLAVTTLSFDIAALELFLPLTVGARVHLVTRRVATDGEQLALALSDCGATVMQATPSTWRLLLAAGWKGDERLTILCGGEALTRELSETLLEKSASVWNMYGPTETTIWSAVSELESSAGPVPLGLPIANTQCYILDELWQPVPLGVSGELYIGGDGLARGYFNRPELTAEKFIPDGFGKKAGGRLYSTGDLARYRPDGAIEYLGRVDQQVKVRGYRIELGEIETVLESHPTVEQSVVVVHESEEGAKRLVAYVVGAQGRAPRTSELASYVKENLPEYMVPASFVALDRLPLLPNGKVDRRSLPEPDLSRPELENAYVAPRNRTEEALAEVWSSVLGVSEVGIDDSFFELGGDSILSVQVVARAYQHGIRVTPKQMFDHKTIRELAKEVSSAPVEAEDNLASVTTRMSQAPLTRAAREGAIPLSFAQQRLWFLDRLQPGLVAYNNSAALRLGGKLDTLALERTLTEIIRRHENLRTTFGQVDGQPVQLIASPEASRWLLVDLSEVASEEREASIQYHAREHARQPFDLATGPLLRTTLLRLSSEEHVALFTMHHIISDGWSLGVLVKEVAALYTAYSRGEESTLEELSIQYADYAVWQREWLQGEALDAQVGYWKKNLAGAPELLDLASNRTRPSTPTFRGAQAPLRISQGLTAEIKRLSQHEGATLFISLLAAFNVLLHYYTRREDIIVGTDVANRTRVEMESLIGFFVNQLVLRTDLSGDPTFGELLGRVRETALGAYDNQDVPFEKIVEAVNPARSTTYAPLFQVKLTLQNAPTEALVLPGLDISPLRIDTGSSRLDLFINLHDTEDGLAGIVEYSTDLFEETAIKHLIENYEAILRHITIDPQTRLSRLRQLVAEAEEQRWTAARKELKAAGLGKLKGARRRAVA
jgi:amino acid adenylation domain-containing protein